MIHIVARNETYAKVFANGEEYIYAKTSMDLFGASEIHVIMDWEFGKSTCDKRKFKAMIAAQKMNPRCDIIRHDIYEKGK